MELFCPDGRCRSERRQSTSGERLKRLTMGRSTRVVLLVTALSGLWVVPRSGEGTALPFLELEHLTDISDLIVQAKVVAVESDWNSSRSRLRTRVTLEVQKVLHGPPDREKLSIDLPGGYLPEENVRQVIPGIPRFAIGEEAIVFLRNDAGLICPIVGWMQGNFRIVTEPGNGRKMVLDTLGKARRYLERKGHAGKLRTLAQGQGLTVEEFAATIAEIQSERGSRK